jgi:hypothetical protein
MSSNVMTQHKTHENSHRPIAYTTIYVLVNNCIRRALSNTDSEHFIIYTKIGMLQYGNIVPFLQCIEQSDHLTGLILEIGTEFINITYTNLILRFYTQITSAYWGDYCSVRLIFSVLTRIQDFAVRKITSLKHLIWRRIFISVFWCHHWNISVFFQHCRLSWVISHLHIFVVNIARIWSVVESSDD